MGEVALYFVIAYACSALALFLGLRRKIGSGRVKSRLDGALAITCVALFLPWVPYAWVGIETYAVSGRVVSATREALQANGDGSDIRIIRVMYAIQKNALVYAVVGGFGPDGFCPGGGRTAFLVGLVNERGRWRPAPSAVNNVWSDCGSADSNTFPPYPDKDIR